MSDFVPVAKVSEIPDPGRQLVEIDDRLVVVFHAAGNFYALDDVCTHDGGPLGEGKLEGLSVACPRHGAKFDLRDGRALTMPATKPTVAHQVRIEGDQILVKLNSDL
jgi:3-phenylpropionate/trans-cinnamate dioxygenase ferredoxin component